MYLTVQVQWTYGNTCQWWHEWLSQCFLSAATKSPVEVSAKWILWWQEQTQGESNQAPLLLLLSGTTNRGYAFCIIHEESALEHTVKQQKRDDTSFISPRRTYGALGANTRVLACVSIRYIDLTRKSVSSLEQCPLGHCSSVAYSIQVRFIASVCCFLTRNVMKTHDKNQSFFCDVF